MTSAIPMQIKLTPSVQLGLLPSKRRFHRGHSVRGMNIRLCLSVGRLKMPSCFPNSAYLSKQDLALQDSISQIWVLRFKMGLHGLQRDAGQTRLATFVIVTCHAVK